MTVLGFRKRKSGEIYPITERDKDSQFSKYLTEKEALELQAKKIELRESIDARMDELEDEFDACDNDHDRIKVLNEERKLLDVIDKSQKEVSGLQAFKQILLSRIDAQERRLDSSEK